MVCMDFWVDLAGWAGFEQVEMWEGQVWVKERQLDVTGEIKSISYLLLQNKSPQTWWLQATFIILWFLWVRKGSHKDMNTKRSY